MAPDRTPIDMKPYGYMGSNFDQVRRDVEKFWRQWKTWIISGAVLGVVLLTALTAFYTVEANEEAVVLRFGKYRDTAGAGLHFKLPFWIDRIFKQEVKTIHKLEFGFRTVRSDVESQFDYSKTDAKNTALMLTADLNCAEINWVVRYRIDDVKAYIFNVENVPEAIRDASEAVMRKIVGDSSIDEILMTRPSEMENLAREDIQEILNLYGCGVDVRTVKFKRLDPPKPVQNAFDQVNQARQMRDQIINEAEAQKNRELIPAEGQKLRMVEKANGYKEKRTNEALGDAKAFLAVLEEYQKAKEITRLRLYLETMSKVLPRCGKITLIDEDQEGVLPLLPLGEKEGGGR